MRHFPITIVTVIFADELPLLQLQAKSFAQHLDPDKVADILVVLQGNNKRFFDLARRILPDYGILSEKVRFVLEQEISSIPKVDGWIAQQILKLKIAFLVKTDNYLILDGKTHLKSSLQDDFLYKDDKILLNTYTYDGHGLRDRLIICLKYFKLDEVYANAFASSVPPLLLKKSIVTSLIEYIEKKSGSSFEREFINSNLTEFFLYFSYIIKEYGDFKQFYEPGQRHSSTVFEHKASYSAVDFELNRGPISPFMSIHRRSYIKLDKEAALRISKAWHQGKLFQSTEEGMRFISSYRRRYFPRFVKEVALKRLRKALQR